MIELEQLQGARLSEASKGNFFLSRSKNEPAFLVGEAGVRTDEAKPVVVNLNSPSFELSHHDGSERRGLIVPRWQMFIDPDSRLPSHGSEIESVPLGSIVLEASNVSLLALNPRFNTRHYVSVIGDIIDSDSRYATAFIDWAICVRDESGGWCRLFENGGKAALGLD